MNHSIFSKSGDWLAAAANPHAARRQRLFWPRVASHAVLKTNPLNCHSFIFLWNFRHNNLWDHLSYQRIHMLEQWTWIDVRISEQNSRSYTQIQSRSCLRQHLHHFFFKFFYKYDEEKNGADFIPTFLNSAYSWARKGAIKMMTPFGKYGLSSAFTSEVVQQRKQSITQGICVPTSTTI